VPVGGTAPLQPPEAVQLCAFAAFHCRTTDWPTATLLSFAFRLTVGGAADGATASVVPVKLCDDAPHAVSALSTANPRTDFHRSPWQTRRLQCLEFIRRVSPDLRRQLFPRSVLPFIRNN
jgi:hypothetical protein